MIVSIDTSAKFKRLHVYERCKSPEPCSGCKYEGHDCQYESLSQCTVCGGLEGALLPSCPGVRLSAEEHDTNYKHYCEMTGPFAYRKLTG